MSVVSRSHFDLVRSRKILEKAFDDQDWDALREADRHLGEQLDKAFADKNRNARELVQELERVLATYANLVALLPESAATSLSFFPQSRS